MMQAVEGASVDPSASNESVAAIIQNLRASLDRVIIGKGKVVRQLVTSLLSGGHVLIEDVPGTGKTVLARALAKSVSANFRRVQFTPDMVPSDLMGVSIFDLEKKKFVFKPGPIFTHVLLADEINRTTPKTQACLLESMAEGQVSVEGRSYPLERPFFVIATQNPVESHGCYPLPEAQLDRFLMKLSIGYPDPQQEERILEDQKDTHPLESLEPVCTAKDLVAVQDAVRALPMASEIVRYIVRIVNRTRGHPDIDLGVSTRGSLALRRAAQASALIAGRRHVLPDDVKEVCVPVLAHRLILRHQAQLEGRSGIMAIRAIVESEAVEE